MSFLLCLLSLGMSLLAPQGELTVRFHTEPREVEVGQPFALVLDLRAPAAADVSGAVVGEPNFDGSWVLLGERRPAPFVDPADPEQRVLRRVFDLVSLEPGERSLGEVLSELTYGAQVARVELGDATLTVTSVLAADEDEPRPMRGFPAGFGQAAPLLERSPWVLALGAAAVVFWIVVLALVARLVWRRNRRPRADAPTPLELFGRLERESAQEAERLRERHFELTRLVRIAADASGAEGRAQDLRGLSDDEWLERGLAATRVPAAAQESIRFVLERAAEVKYGGRVPTEWAFKETLERARAALELCARGPAEGVAR